MRIRIAALSFAAVAQIAVADTPANIVVEGRGLPQVQGVVRDSSKVEWGFANFIAFGPNWAYTAQDYAAKEHKKEPIADPALGRGLLFTAKIWAGSRGLSIREEFYDVSKQGEAKARARWKIASLDGKRTDTKAWGKLPYLAKTGSAKVSLKNANAGLSFYALASDGTRLRKVPAKYANGAYLFTVSVAAGEGKDAPTMMYELAK